MVRIARWRLLVACLAACVAVSCGPTSGKPPLTKPGAVSFADYTTPEVESLAEFRQLAAVTSTVAERPAIAGTKFVITNFSDAERRKIHYLDGRYYQFHDEWAWFRLLNGRSVPGMAPLVPHAFGAPEDARRWASAHEEELPEGLEMRDGRLYAPQFYELSLAANARDLGAGSLIHVPARPTRPELWGFEVDYTDPVKVEELLVFFELLEKSIPREARPTLHWFARSPAQLEVGKALVARRPSLHGRVRTYSELSIPGETSIYTGGIVAGRLKAFRELSRLGEAEPEDILLLGALPEYLPQARGLVTAIPQTPLAHLNLLAKSRQIVNAYRGGVLDDPEVQDLLRSRAPVVLSAEGGRLRLHRLTEEQYASWQSSLRSDPPTVPAVDLQGVPYLIDLSQVEVALLPKLAPLIGGKSVGMVHLLRGLGPGTPQNGAGVLRVDVPDRPLALTIRAYREHLAKLLPELRALLSDENFLKFKKLRFLALEGDKEFVRKFPSRKDRELARSYQNPHAVGPIAGVVRQGGIAHMIRRAPLPPALRAELESALPRHFGAYSPEQGLRFRSSSTVEDIEGFNGAGLYDSATGYLVPRKATGKDPKRPSVADALRKTWASYFSFEAFEERHQHHIDHLAADMAVLIHARFDDASEHANGVFTFTLSPKHAELSVDAQPGALSVTNPPTDRVVIPESTWIRQSGERLEVSRKTLSSLLKPGQQVMSDAELQELFGLAQQLTAQLLVAGNIGVPPAQRRRSLVTDFEFRRVVAGWPALRRGQHAARFVIKQLRPLEPSPRVSAQLRAAPIPYDVLSRARQIETRLCRGVGLELQALLVLTDPEVAPDVGYAEQPLLAGLGVTYRGSPLRVITHLEQRSSRVEADGFRIELAPGLAFQRVEVAGGIATLTRSRGGSESVPVSCETRLDYAEPRELLRSFLGEPTTQ